MQRQRGHTGQPPGLSWLRSFAVVSATNPPCYASALQVIWRQFDLNTVTNSDPNVILPHLATEMGKHLMASVEFNGEKRIRKGLFDDPIHNDLRIVNPTLPATRLGLHHPYASLQPARLGAGLSLTCQSST